MACDLRIHDVHVNPTPTPPFFSCFVLFLAIYQCCGIFKLLNFGMPALSEPKPKLQCIRKMSREPQNIRIWQYLFTRTYDKRWLSYSNLKTWPPFWPCDVTDDVMNTWRITCTNTHPHLYTSNLPLVWHLSFINRDTHRDTQTRRVNLVNAGDRYCDEITTLYIKSRILFQMLQKKLKCLGCWDNGAHCWNRW